MSLKTQLHTVKKSYFFKKGIANSSSKSEKVCFS
jgi:hypothetical protein